MILAIDYDGTITENDDSYPEVGKLNPKAVKVLKRLKEKGHILCLWTCRSYRDGTLQKAIQQLEENDIHFDYFNESPVDTGSPKIACHYYIDDRMLGQKVDWDYIEKTLCL